MLLLGVLLGLMKEVESDSVEVLVLLLPQAFNRLIELIAISRLRKIFIDMNRFVR
jgi:hypothetical protein